MRCSYLEVEPVARCLAYTDGIRILRDSELEDFCYSEDYISCQIYRQRTTGGKKQPESKNSTPKGVDG
jgi:hypothetical protein